MHNVVEMVEMVELQEMAVPPRQSAGWQQVMDGPATIAIKAFSTISTNSTTV